MKILSLKSVLLYQLGRILLCDIETDSLCFTDFLHDLAKSSRRASSSRNQKSINWRKIPIEKKSSRRQNIPRFLYVSALPQTLTASSSVTVGANPSAIFQAAVNRLNHARSNLKSKLTDKQTLYSSQTLPIETQLWLAFEIETQKSGWLAFELSEKGLDIWLHHLCKQPSQSSSIAGSTSLKPATLETSTHQLLWQVQYTHACCARLLARADTANPALDSAENMHREYRQSELWQNEAVRSLVHTLMDTADALFWIPYQWPTQQYLLLLKRATPLCQSFEHFYRACLCESWQPYAELEEGAIAHKTHSQHLIIATKNILKVLLEEHLGEVAPEKL